MTCAERLVLAAEGGGTRLTLWLLGPDETLGTRVAGPGNPSTRGAVEFVRYLDQEAMTLLASCGRRREDVTAVTLALAGVEDPQVRAELGRGLTAAGWTGRLAIAGDASVTLLGCTGGEPGGLLIAGTGSIAWARGPGGSEARCGGWGPAAGDEGSGHDLGRRVLRRLVLHLDGRAPDPVLMARFTDFLAAHGSSLDPTAWIRGHAGRPDLVASLAPLLIAAAQVGDPQSLEALDHAAAELVALASTVATRADLPPGAPFYLHGGLLHGVAPYRDRVIAGLTPRPVHLTPPGAVLRGLRLQVDA